MVRQWVLLFAVLLSAQAFAKKNVCTVTINSKEEREVFRSQLNPRDFNFIELTDYATNKTNRTDDWFENACEQKVQCDVLVVSGHFGGSFFGDSGLSLGLNDLEKRSCQSRCSGILEKPKEVFLLGCNTLASKDLDHRTPQQYYQALMEHEIDGAEAERIVAARYSPIGSSNSDRMRRIFEGVPFIYGFSSVGPSGKNIKSSLTKYLQEIGDYNRHLDDIGAGRVSNNTIFQKNMTAYTTAITSGAKKSDSVYGVKVNSCQLSDESKTLEERIEHAGKMLEESPFIYFPTVSEFVSSHFSSDAIYSGDSDISDPLIRITAKTDLKEKVLKIASAGGFGPVLQMDLLNFARRVRWITGDEFDQKSKELLIGLMKTPTIQNADSFCSVVSESNLEGFSLTRSDLPSNFDFKSPQSIKMLGCIEINDPALMREALSAALKLDVTKLSLESRFAVYGLLESIQGYENEITQFLLSQPVATGRYAKEINRYVKSLILKKAPSDQQAIVYKRYQEEAKGNEDVLDSYQYYAMQNSNIHPEVESSILYEHYKSCNSDSCYFERFSGNPIVQKWLAKYIDFKAKPRFAVTLLEAANNSDHADTFKLTYELAQALFPLLFDSKLQQNYDYIFLTTRLAEADLNTNQVQQVRQYLRTISQPSYHYAQSLKYIIYLHQDKFTDITPSEFDGASKYLCRKTGRNGTTCKSETVR